MVADAAWRVCLSPPVSKTSPLPSANAGGSYLLTTYVPFELLPELSVRTDRHHRKGGKEIPSPPVPLTPK